MNEYLQELISELASELGFALGTPIVGWAAFIVQLPKLISYLEQLFSGRPKMLDTIIVQKALAADEWWPIRALAANLEIWVRNGVPLSTSNPTYQRELSGWKHGTDVSLMSLAPTKLTNIYLLNNLLNLAMTSEFGPRAQRVLDSLVRAAVYESQHPTAAPAPRPAPVPRSVPAPLATTSPTIAPTIVSQPAAVSAPAPILRTQAAIAAAPSLPLITAPIPRAVPAPQLTPVSTVMPSSSIAPAGQGGAPAPAPRPAPIAPPAPQVSCPQWMPSSLCSTYRSVLSHQTALEVGEFAACLALAETPVLAVECLQKLVLKLALQQAKALAQELIQYFRAPRPVPQPQPVDPPTPAILDRFLAVPGRAAVRPYNASWPLPAGDRSSRHVASAVMAPQAPTSLRLPTQQIAAIPCGCGVEQEEEI